MCTSRFLRGPVQVHPLVMKVQYASRPSISRRQALSGNTYRQRDRWVKTKINGALDSY